MERWMMTMMVVKVVLGAAPVDWIERSPSGAYQFGYATGDSGGHYREEAASADNTLAGKFGFRDPATGANLETTYTSGRRGFRARGPHIARRMGLSQIGGPNRPNDGQYHPELDNVFDPTEDRGYDFRFRTKDTVKEEHADARGDVRGRYSYLDDVGGRHSVEYTAGANTGFNVQNPVPDTFHQAQASPLVFHGKGPASRARGYTAIQKSLDGSYRFSASGPDHKRTEVSDSVGNRRGSYTYLDDKGQQRTVEYIAGPNIGYQVINNRRPLLFGPTGAPIPPLNPSLPSLNPLFPDSPSSTPFPTTPFSPFFPDPPLSVEPPFSSTDGWTPSTSTAQPPSWTTTPSWAETDSGVHDLNVNQLFPETLNTAPSGGPQNNRNKTTGSAGSGGASCCGKSWSNGPKRAYRGRLRYDGYQPPNRALRAHVQNVDATDQRAMSPSDALELYGSGHIEHRGWRDFSGQESQVSEVRATPQGEKVQPTDAKSEINVTKNETPSTDVDATDSKMIHKLIEAFESEKGATTEKFDSELTTTIRIE